jgi:hypothetical protein
MEVDGLGGILKDRISDMKIHSGLSKSGSQFESTYSFIIKSIVSTFSEISIMNIISL